MIDEEAAERLIEAARAAARHAYAPYSRFAVGAAVLMKDGDVVTGANVENASYGLSLCAETVAIATLAARGRIGDVAGIGIVGGSMDGGGDAAVRPCGRCRQVLNEAAQRSGVDLVVICGGLTGEERARYRLSELLPDAFGPRDLGL